MQKGTAISLPSEILDHILKNRNLGIEDVMHFALTCKHLYKLITASNHLWRTKFFQRCPHLQERTEYIENLDWLKETEQRTLCGKVVMEKISGMSAKHYLDSMLTSWDLREYNQLFLPEYGVHPMNYDYIVDELISLVEQRDDNVNFNLTHKYYAKIVLQHVRRKYLSIEWHEFKGLPTKRHTREWILNFFILWYYPWIRITHESSAKVMDEIADKVRALVAETHPMNPINFVSREDLHRWKNENLSENHWNAEDSKQILLELCKAASDAVPAFRHPWITSHVDYVSHRLPLTPATFKGFQAVLYESVARRLGLSIEMFYDKEHLLHVIKWNPQANPDEHKEVKCQCLAFVDGCPQDVEEIDSEAWQNAPRSRTAKEFMIELSDLPGKYEMLEFLYMNEPHDLRTIWPLAKMYRRYNANITELIQNLTKGISNETDPRPWTIDDRMTMIREWKSYEIRKSMLRNNKQLILLPKRRRPYIAFAVGMLAVRFRRFGVENLCVVIYWGDEMNLFLDSIIRPREGAQIWETWGSQNVYCTIYNFDDDIYSYVPQRLLRPLTEREIIGAVRTCRSNSKVGRFFRKFTGTHYLPNKELASKYPEDEEFCSQLYAGIKQ